MHPSLARQLRRLCGIENAEQLAQRLQELHDTARTPELAAFANGLVAIFARVNSTYEQNDRDLALRSRSLEQSSAELSTINDQMRNDIASRNRVLQSVREAVNTLLENNNVICGTSADDDLEGLSALLPILVEQQEQHRLELANQRFAMDQHAIVSITDTQGNIRYVNDRFCQISGYAREELLGKNHRIVSSHHHNPFFYDNLWRTISTGNVWRGEICNKDKNHNLYWVDSTIVPFLDDDGKPYQYIGILTDISNSKRMAAKVAASEQQYRSLVENVREVIFQLDELGRWVFLNSAWTEITGFEVKDSISRNFLDYVFHDDIDKTFAVFQQLAIGKIHSHRSEKRFYDNHGGYCWFEVTLQSEIDPQTHSLIFTGTLNDITERRRIAQLQSEFISVVSHELRTPLTSIRGSLGLLEAGHGGPLAETQQKLVNIAHKNSQRLVALVNDILDMEKLMAGKMSIKSDQLNLVQLAESAIEANAAYAHTYGVKFKLCMHPTEAIIQGDADRLMQVMSNLLSNAAKYSPKDRPVEIDIINEHNHTKVSVRDYGPGIPVEFRPRVFSAFAQADSSDTRQQGGTGLGLKISKTLVEKMGGRMGFDTELGTGTSFWFQMPLTSKKDSEFHFQAAL